MSQDLIAALTQLLPGFLTAWVVYGLTTYTKPAQFERIVQAFIYSFIVSALVTLLERALTFASRWVSLGVWDESSRTLASAIVALSLGVLMSYLMRSDAFFSRARRLGITSRTPYPSEWYGAFATQPPRYVVLHMAGGRRIIGYPLEWPTEPTVGHFRLTEAAWLGEDNRPIELEGDESVLLAASQVELVEFLKPLERTQNVSEATEPSAASSSPI